MNIYDIAEKCGVSIATVSRVLNNNPNVSAATRAKIQAVIDEANYTPSAIARNLGNGAEAVSAAPATAAPTVGVLCSDIRDPYCANILSALVEQMKDSGVDLLLGQSGDTPESEKAALTRMLAHPVIAVMYIGPNHYDNPTDAPLATAAAQVPVILLDGYVEAPNIYGIIGDQPAAVTEIVAGLLRRQRRRILLLHSRVTHSCREKIRGYQQAYAAAGLEVDPALIVEVGNRPEDINTTIKQLLVKRVTFDAIIGTEDMVALGAQKALQRTGLSMPVVGFHNTLIASCSTPALTSVECDPAAMAAAAHRARELYEKTADPRMIDAVLDAACYEDMLTAARETGDDTLVGWLQMRIDLTNILITLRILRLGKGFSAGGVAEDLLIPGGTLDAAFFGEALENGESRLWEVLSPTEYYPLTRVEGDPRPLYAVEKACDDLYVERVRTDAGTPFGAAVVGGHLVGWETAVKNIRILLAAKEAGWSTETIRERIRVSYV